VHAVPNTVQCNKVLYPAEADKYCIHMLTVWFSPAG